MDWQFVSRVKVYFRDLDAMGHVNNAVYLSYLEIVRMDFLEELFGPDYFQRMPYVLADVHVKFVRSAKLRDVLEIGVRVPRVGSKSFTLEYVIRDTATGAVMAEADSVQVFYDYKAGQSFPAPEEFRARIRQLQGGGT